MGSAEAELKTLPIPPQHQGEGQVIATIMDNIPMVNVAAFGNCKSLANPMVAAATAAAQGVLQQQPCLPVLPGPWTMGGTIVTSKGNPVLLDSSMLTCAYGMGSFITVSDPGQAKVEGK